MARPANTDRLEAQILLLTGKGLTISWLVQDRSGQGTAGGGHTSPLQNTTSQLGSALLSKVLKSFPVFLMCCPVFCGLAH